MTTFEIITAALLITAAVFAYRCWGLISKLKVATENPQIANAAEELEDHLCDEDTALLRAALLEAHTQGRREAFKHVQTVLERNFTNIEAYIDSNIELDISSEEDFEPIDEEEPTAAIGPVGMSRPVAVA